MFDEKEKLDTLAREVNATCHVEGITVIFDVNGWTANTAQVSKTGKTSALKKTIFHPPQAWLDKHPNVKYVPHKGLVKSDVKHEMRAWAKRESANQHPDIPAAAQPGGPVPITGVAAQGQQSSGRKHSAVPTKSGTGSSDEQPPTQNVLDVPLSKRRRLLTPPVSKAVSQGQPGSGIRNDSIMQQAKTAAGSQVTAAHMRPPPLQGPGEQNATAATASSEHVARMQQQLTAALQDQDVEHRKLWDDFKQLKAEVAELQCSAKSQGQQEGETSKGRLQCIVNVGRVSRKRMDVEAHLLGLLTILQQLGKMSVSKSVAEALNSSQHDMEIRKILLDIVEEMSASLWQDKEFQVLLNSWAFYAHIQ